MEAVGAFIEGCKKYGLTEKDCCVTLDIYERQAGDQNMVRLALSVYSYSIMSCSSNLKHANGIVSLHPRKFYQCM